MRTKWRPKINSGQVDNKNNLNYFFVILHNYPAGVESLNKLSLFLLEINLIFNQFQQRSAPLPLLTHTTDIKFLDTVRIFSWFFRAIRISSNISFTRHFARILIHSLGLQTGCYFYFLIRSKARATQYLQLKVYILICPVFFLWKRGNVEWRYYCKFYTLSTYYILRTCPWAAFQGRNSPFCDPDRSEYSRLNEYHNLRKAW